MTGANFFPRGAVSWTSPDPALRCGIATVTVAPQKMPDMDNWMCKEKKVRTLEIQSALNAARYSSQKGAPPAPGKME